MMKRVGSFYVLLVALMLAPMAAMATEPTPTYTVDLSQVSTDVGAAITALLALVLIIFGGKKVMGLFGR